MHGNGFCDHPLAVSDPRHVRDDVRVVQIGGHDDVARRLQAHADRAAHPPGAAGDERDARCHPMTLGSTSVATSSSISRSS